MIYKYIMNFRKDIYNIMEQIITYNEPVNIGTKNGNVAMLSEEDYNGLMETLALTSIKGMKEKLEEEMNTPLDGCIDENEVD